MPATYNHSADDATSAAMRLMRASDYFKSACYLTVRFASEHGESNNTRGRLLLFTAIRSPGLITLVTQDMSYSEEAKVHVYKPLMGFCELTALLEDFDENPRKHGFASLDDVFGEDDRSDASSMRSYHNRWRPDTFLDCLNNFSCECKRCRVSEPADARKESLHTGDSSVSPTPQYASEEEEPLSGEYYDSGVNPHGHGGHWHDREG
ncbi:hypothetical protein B0A48_06013 [Cryoendolithus antarcticus]|uniref:Uncharacterized protein n=1 Tax=Cryoendolithus antarcticus TaxID=1507870 RepID=A0A1V8TD39_9PEZI|nr:hypothetical protein B0A48_06013 [Cryoendolithus antarcticus]